MIDCVAGLRLGFVFLPELKRGFFAIDLLLKKLKAVF